jgi:hypothetical protein
VEITVPVVAGLSAATNAINTAIITDDQNRTSQDTFAVTINVDPSVSAAVYALLLRLLTAVQFECTLHHIPHLHPWSTVTG